jgi:hypothetical protein
MRRPASALWWFLLVPYFWVKSLNSRPFFGEDREFANRANGLLALALVLMFVVFGLLSRTDLRHLLRSTVFDVGVYAVALVAAALLVNRERDRQYLARYHAMARTKRRAFGLAVLLVLTIAVIAAMLPRNEHPTATKSLSCPTGEETTAECS